MLVEASCGVVSNSWVFLSLNDVTHVCSMSAVNCHHHQCIYSTTEQYKYSDNVDTNEVETGMTRLIALTVTPVY